MVIYTAIVNNTDTIKIPEVINPTVDYVIFTDLEAPVPAPWQKIPIEAHYRNPRVTAKYYKMNPHLLFEDYDISIWLDGSMLIHQDFVGKAIRLMKKYDFVAFSHSKRNCLYVEAEVVKRVGFDSFEVVEAHVVRLRAEAYPENNGLLSSGLLIRRHHLLVEASEGWWQEILSGSQRDQVSGNYVLWKYGVKYHLLDANIRENKYFTIVPHHFRDAYLPDEESFS